jgi:flagellar basal body rod protein FlgG
MNRGVYTAATGMVAQQTRLDVLANNLANVNTRGFKVDRVTFADMMDRTMADDAGYGSNLGSLGSGPAVATQTTDFAAGSAEVTDNPFDMMIGGGSNAMFQVRKANGDVRFTRDGSFSLNASRQLVTKAGDLVMDGQGQAITVPENARIDKGAVLVDGKAVATVGRFQGTFVKDRNGNNQYESANAQADAAVPVETGFLESSNVEPVSMMVEMIALQRNYELAQKMVQSQDESTGRLAEAMG